MNQGNCNCCDHHVSPHFAQTAPPNCTSRPHVFRHESWEEMERRCRSPASLRPKFPLLKLPLELRQEIFSYILPRTRELLLSNPLASHARSFHAVQEREKKGMALPKKTAPPSSVKASLNGVGSPLRNIGSTGLVSSNVVWQRGNINLLCVCRQLHDECANMMYGSNTFMLFVTFERITFRFRWLSLNGLAPSRSFDFLELLPERYMQRIKRIVVHVDHVDSYTGMIKFNVGGKGLTHGLRIQVQRLVNALKPADSDHERRLSKISIRISNGNAVLDTIKSDDVRKREGIKVAEDIKDMLEPFKQLYDVREASVSGAITDELAQELEDRMRSKERPAQNAKNVIFDDHGLGAPVDGVCVYGNDMI